MPLLSRTFRKAAYVANRAILPGGKVKRKELPEKYKKALAIQVPNCTLTAVKGSGLTDGSSGKIFL
jgi:hypothetical protein